MLHYIVLDRHPQAGVKSLNVAKKVSSQKRSRIICLQMPIGILLCNVMKFIHFKFDLSA